MTQWFSIPIITMSPQLLSYHFLTRLPTGIRNLFDPNQLPITNQKHSILLYESPFRILICRRFTRHNEMLAMLPRIFTCMWIMSLGTLGCMLSIGALPMSFSMRTFGSIRMVGILSV